MQKIIVLSGPSGVGKDSIIQTILKQDSDFVIPVTMTSRPQRDNENDGEDYFFVSKDEFELSINNNKLIEYSSVYEHYYGIPKSSMKNALATGKNILVRLDVKGSITLMKQYSNSVSIFITPEDINQLIEQITFRSQDNQDEIERRMNIAIQEIAQANLFDHVVLNEKEQLEETVKIILDIIEYKK